MDRYKNRLGALAFYVDTEIGLLEGLATAARQRGDFSEAKKLENARFALGEAASMIRDARDGV